MKGVKDIVIVIILDVITENKQATVIKRYCIVMILDVITANKQAALIKRCCYCNDSSCN